MLRIYEVDCGSVEEAQGHCCEVEHTFLTPAMAAPTTARMSNRLDDLQFRFRVYIVLPTSLLSLSFIISSLLLIVIMFCHAMFVHSTLILAAITHVATASHLRRYHRYHRDALNNPDLQGGDETEP